MKLSHLGLLTLAKIIILANFYLIGSVSFAYESRFVQSQEDLKYSIINPIRTYLRDLRNEYPVTKNTGNVMRLSYQGYYHKCNQGYFKIQISRKQITLEDNRLQIQEIIKYYSCSKFLGQIKLIRRGSDISPAENIDLIKLKLPTVNEADYYKFTISWMKIEFLYKASELKSETTINLKNEYKLKLHESFNGNNKYRRFEVDYPNQETVYLKAKLDGEDTIYSVDSDYNMVSASGFAGFYLEKTEIVLEYTERYVEYSSKESWPVIKKEGEESSSRH